MKAAATAILAAILSLAIATSAVAESGGWNVRTRKDPMTDRMETSAVLMPRDGGTAILYVACLNGRVTPRLVYARSIGYVQVSGTWRLDDAPVRGKFVALSDDGTQAWLEVTPAQITKAKRLRAQVGSQPMSDYDLTGAGEALKGIQCK